MLRVALTSPSPFLVLVGVPWALVCTGCSLKTDIQRALDQGRDTAKEIKRFSKDVRGAYYENDQRLQLLADEMQVLTGRSSEVAVKLSDVSDNLKNTSHTIGIVAAELQGVPFTSFALILLVNVLGSVAVMLFTLFRRRSRA